MKFELFIANRYAKPANKDRKILSGPMVKIATFGVVLGVTVMILSVAIVLGFKKEIREKVSGFGAHIQLVKYDLNKSYESKPITRYWPFLEEIVQYEEVEHIQPFITKPGIIKEDEELEAVVLKGIDHTFDWSFFNKYLIQGSTIAIDTGKVSKEILLSEYIAKRLSLGVGDYVNMYFMQKPIRLRKFKIVGIYQTNLKLYDELFAIVDLRQLQKLNGWQEDQISGFEIFVDQFDNIIPADKKISERVAVEFDENGGALQTVTTLEQAPQIYDWLNLQNMNVWVILILITLVAGINMITGLLIMILEKTNDIGVLKALGATNRQIGKVFLIQASKIIGKGMLIGNFTGILICWLQLRFGIISLDPDNYYLAHVPIYLNVSYLVFLNMLIFIVNIVMMVVPAMVATKINPAKAIQFD